MHAQTRRETSSCRERITHAHVGYCHGGGDFIPCKDFRGRFSQGGENSMRHRRISHSVDERWPCSRSKPVCRCYGNNLASYRRQPARLGTAHLPALIYSWQLLIAYKALTHLLTCTGKMARCTTRSSAVAEGQRDAMCRLKPGEMLHKSLSNCI